MLPKESDVRLSIGPNETPAGNGTGSRRPSIIVKSIRSVPTHNVPRRSTCTLRTHNACGLPRFASPSVSA